LKISAFDPVQVDAGNLQKLTFEPLEIPRALSPPSGDQARFFIAVVAHDVRSAPGPAPQALCPPAGCRPHFPPSRL